MTTSHVFSMPKQAARLDHLPPYGFAIIGQRIAELKAAGVDIIRLDIGSPDLPPPDHVVAALKRSADNPSNHSYGSYRGDAGYRRAVASYYQRRFGVELDSEREVLPLIGSKEGIVALALAFLDHGDQVLVPNINYPAYNGGAMIAGAEPVEVRLDPTANYRPRLDEIRADISRAKLLWVNYPNNPTAGCIELDVYQEIVDFCRQRNILLASDNPYAEVVFDGYRAPSALQIVGAKACTVEFMSLSKMYNMAGWRLGAIVGNAEAIDRVLTIKSNMDSQHFKAVYDAGTAALMETSDAWIAQRNMVYQRRRDNIMAALPEIGLSAQKPKASLYFWAKVDHGDDQQYCDEALANAGVSVTPGRMYGPAGIGYVRLSLGIEDPRLDEALSRLRNWYSKR